MQISSGSCADCLWFGFHQFSPPPEVLSRRRRVTSRTKAEPTVGNGMDLPTALSQFNGYTTVACLSERTVWNERKTTNKCVYDRRKYFRQYSGVKNVIYY